MTNNRKPFDPSTKLREFKLKTRRPRRRYDDKFRASAVVMLEAAGYPDRDGALSHTANHLGIPLNTLKGWFTAKNNPPPCETSQQKAP